MSFLFVDRILDFIPGKSCRGLKHITHNDTYMFRNKNDNLCFNPSMIGETLGQLAAWNAMFSVDFQKRPVAGVVESARLNRNILVGETLILEAVLDNIDDTAVQYHAFAKVGDEEVFRISSALGPMLPMNDFINEDLVRRQYNEISRPGEWHDEHSDIELIPGVTQAPIVPLSYDKVVECEPLVRIVATMKVSRQAPFFPDHFPNKPVLPMTALLECNINLAHIFIAKSNFKNQYQLQELRKIKMNDFVHPGDEVKTSITIKHHDENELILRFRSEVSGRRVCVLEIVMTNLGTI
ncbi:MAG: hydroxymyristoyl-ACP dehydratase [Legionellaceae bacterium]|nr:hydroxymyristoyl-ACP dehydratase [Legionellaceae bacterium]